MTNFSTQFGQTGGSDPKFVLPFSVSGIFTAPYDMDVKITAIGGGGSGGLIQGNTSGAFASGAGGNASGGGPGALVIKKTRLLTGASLTINIGAAGAAIISNTTAQFSSDGNDGGDTTVTGTGVAITAPGGKKGKATAGNVACNGGLAGVGTGGDINLSGGRGGNITANTGGTYFARASGGGAVNVGLGAFNGGDISSTYSGGGFIGIASGGGGIFSAAAAMSGAVVANDSGPGGGTGLLTALGTTVPDLRRLFNLYPTLGPAALGGTTGGSSLVNPGVGTGTGGDFGTTSSPNWAAPSGQFGGQGGAANSQGIGASGAANNNAVQGTLGGTNGGGGLNGSGGGGGGGAASRYGIAAGSSGRGQSGLVILELF